MKEEEEEGWVGSRLCEGQSMSFNDGPTAKRLATTETKRSNQNTEPSLSTQRRVTGVSKNATSEEAG
jgi:hypothetical protein